MSKDRKIGGGTRNPQYDSVAIPDVYVAVTITPHGRNRKVPPEERVRGVGYFHLVGRGLFTTTKWVVEGGINNCCRSTTSATSGC
jgi:hypothetical protein